MGHASFRLIGIVTASVAFSAMAQQTTTQGQAARQTSFGKSAFSTPATQNSTSDTASSGHSFDKERRGAQRASQFSGASSNSTTVNDPTAAAINAAAVMRVNAAMQQKSGSGITSANIRSGASSFAREGGPNASASTNGVVSTGQTSTPYSPSAGTKIYSPGVESSDH